MAYRDDHGHFVSKQEDGRKCTHDFETGFRSVFEERGIKVKPKEDWKTTKMASGTIHELGDKRIIEEENEKGDTQYRINGTNGQVFSSLEEAKKAVDKEKYQSILKKAFNALDKQDAMDIIFSNTEVHKAFQKVQRENPNDSFWYQLSLLPDKLYGR